MATENEETKDNEQEGAPKWATDFLNQIKDIVTPPTPEEDEEETVQTVKVPPVPEILTEDEDEEDEEEAPPAKRSFLSRLW